LRVVFRESDARIQHDKTNAAMARLVAEMEEKMTEPIHPSVTRSAWRRIKKPSKETLVSMYPPGWPLCPVCGRPALDGHITCGRAECNEGAHRR